MVGAGVAEMFQVVFVIWLECKSGLHVLHVKYVFVLKLLQVVLM